MEEKVETSITTLKPEDECRFTKNKRFDKSKCKFKTGTEIKTEVDKYFQFIDEKNQARINELKAYEGRSKRHYSLLPYQKEGLVLFLSITAKEFNNYYFSNNQDIVDTMEYIDMRIAEQQLNGAFTGEMDANVAKTYLHHHGIMSSDVSKQIQTDKSKNGSLNVVIISTPEQLEQYRKRGSSEDMIESGEAQTVDITAKVIKK